LAEAERKHVTLADNLEQEYLTPEVEAEEEKAQRRLFVLQIVQPGLAGLMDGSVSTLAPVLRQRFATHNSHAPSWSASPLALEQNSMGSLRQLLMTAA